MKRIILFGIIAIVLVSLINAAVAVKPSDGSSEGYPQAKEIQKPAPQPQLPLTEEEKKAIEGPVIQEVTPSEGVEYKERKMESVEGKHELGAIGYGKDTSIPYISDGANWFKLEEASVELLKSVDLNKLPLFVRYGVAWKTRGISGILDITADILKGYPGFSIFYDAKKVRDWTGLLENDFVNTVLGGIDKWGEAAFCRQVPSQITGGHNTAVSPYLGGASASIAAERVAIENATDPTKNIYIYKIEYYVDAGSDERISCRELQFTVRFKHPRRGDISLYLNSLTRRDWIFTLKSGDKPITPSSVMDSTIPVQLAQSKNDYIGKRFCIKFHKVEPDYCLVGIKEGDEICAVTIDGAHYTPDYKCGNIWCKIFTLGRGWKFEPSIPPAADGGNIIPNSLDDPATGQPPRDSDTGHIILNLD